jgi:hypothetical protein
MLNARIAPWRALLGAFGGFGVGRLMPMLVAVAASVRAVPEQQGGET